MGIAIGVAIGVAMDQIGVGIALGVAFGASLGAAAAKKQKHGESKTQQIDNTPRDNLSSLGAQDKELKRT